MLWFFWPLKVCELQPNSTDISDLKAFPFFTDSVLEDLKQELPLYLAKADGLSVDADKTSWWQADSNELPKWSSAYKQVLLVQPSSAAAERVFSLLENSFSTKSLEGYIS